MKNAYKNAKRKVLIYCFIFGDHSPQAGTGAVCWARASGTPAAPGRARVSGKTDRTERSRRGRAARRSWFLLPTAREERIHTPHVEHDDRKHTHTRALADTRRDATVKSHARSAVRGEQERRRGGGRTSRREGGETREGVEERREASVNWKVFPYCTVWQVGQLEQNSVECNHCLLLLCLLR